MRKPSLAGGALCAALTLAAPSARAAKALQLSVFDPVQVVDSGENIKGLRVSLFLGRNQSVTGMDVGVANRSAGDFTGFRLGVVNLGDARGRGVSWGVVNRYRQGFAGWTNAAVNWVDGPCAGFQGGFVNYAESMRGVQLGLWNQARDLHGVQVGLVNVNAAGDPLSFLPLVLWSFE